MKADWEIRWVDGKHLPRCLPDPRDSDGVDIDTKDADFTCHSELEHPTLRGGVYLVTCRKCGMKAAVTTAGRPDNPRSLRLPCNITLPTTGDGS